MVASMWIFDRALLEIAMRAAIIYVFVLIGIRLSGKREVGQMTIFDLVLLLLIANAVQNAMTGPDTSVTGGMVAAAALLAANALVTRLVWRYRRFRRFVEGTPTLLIHDGRVLTANLARERVTSDELHQALREHGIVGAAEVQLAVLELDGAISVLRRDEMPREARPHHRIRFLRKHN